MYDKIVVYFTYIVFALAVLAYLYHIASGRLDLSKYLVQFLPLFLIVDIPINQAAQYLKPTVPFRLWYIPVILICLMRLDALCRFIVRYQVVLFFFVLFFVLQLVVTSDRSEVFRSIIKIVFLYFPLVFSISVFISEVRLEIRYRMILSAGIAILLINIIQISLFYLFHINFFVLPDFHSPSGTFTEPVWAGIFLGFTIFALPTDGRLYACYKVLAFVMIYLAFIKSAIVIVTLLLLLSIRNFLLRVCLVLCGLLLISIYLFLATNIMQSMVVHSSNWIFGAIAFDYANFFQKLIGQGFGGANILLGHLSQTGQLKFALFDMNHSLGLNLNEAQAAVVVGSSSADLANIILEVLNAFGIVGCVLFLFWIGQIYYRAHLLASPLSKRLFYVLTFFLFISLIHPLYFMGIGIFMLFYVFFSLDQALKPIGETL